MSAWPNYIYEDFMFKLWCAFKAEDQQKRLKEKIQGDYDENDDIKIILDIKWAKRKKIKNLCELKTFVLLNFNKPVFLDDCIEIMVKKQEFLEKFNILIDNFVAIEINNQIERLVP